MEEKWIYRFLRFLRQVFCWHDYICSEGPGMEPEHFVCRKCDHSYTNWESAYINRWNLSAKWWNAYQVALEELSRLDPAKAEEVMDAMNPERNPQPSHPGWSPS